MSKKSRKNPSKASTPRRSSPQSAASAKTTTRTSGRGAAGASRKKASHGAPSKPLRAKTAALGAARTTRGKAAAEGDKAGIAAGVKAPAFRLPRDGGGVVGLADFAGRKLVLFFYPRADTPGCTREAIDFTRLTPAFAESGTAVVGISADPPRAQEAFRDKHKLAVPLVSDETHEMLSAYGAWGEKSMYGKTFLGIIRSTVLIGADGRVIKVWRHVKVDGHAEEVLAAARAT
jgi:peroxiredoxin Q/BCP